MATTPELNGRGSRAAKNQALFREVNERVQELSGGLGAGFPSAEWFCECADESCVERIQMTEAEYAAVREHGRRFAVAPEHVFPDVERVVTRNARYWTVEKVGQAGDVAEALDPRSAGQAG